MSTTQKMTPAHRWLFILLWCGFAVYGAVLTTFGATVPRIIQDLGWSYATTGLVLAATSIGFFFSTFAVGLLLEGTNPKGVYVVAVIGTAVALSLFGRSASPWVNIVVCIVSGAGQGVIEVATQYEVVRIEKPGESRLMNLLHAGFSAGAIVGPIGVGALMQSGLSWKIAFPACGVLFVILALWALATRFPAPERGKHHGAAGGVALLRQPVLLLLCVVIILYVGSELGATNWVAEYLVRVIGASGPVSALGVSVLWGGMMIGRTILSRARQVRRQELLLAGLAVVCMAALAGFLASRSLLPAVVMIFALGLGYSGLYPIVMAIAGRTFRSSAAVGMVSTSAGIGSFSFPFLLAAVSQAAGLRWGFVMLTVLPLGILVASLSMIGRIPAQDQSAGAAG